MNIGMDVREELLRTPDLRNLLDDLEKVWHAEQIKRHAFWAEVDENRKAEFILGEIILSFSGIWQALDGLFQYSDPVVAICER